MTNVALNKQVLEPIEDAGNVTNGDTINYKEDGFSYFKWPGTLTVDLEKVHNIKFLRFLLLDYLRKDNEESSTSERIYKYRILTSLNNKDWLVIYDTSNAGYSGWQVFSFPDTIQCRFIKIHGIYHSMNDYFHVVELEAYDDDPPKLNSKISLERKIFIENIQHEKSDSYLLSVRVNKIIDEIKHIIKEYPIINSEQLTSITNDLSTQLDDLNIIERGLDSIRREIIGPIKIRLDKSEKLSRFSLWGFWVGLVGGILAIF